MSLVTTLVPFSVSELEVVFGHAFQLLLQLNEVDYRCQHYWGRPSRLTLGYCLWWDGLRDRGVSFLIGCPEGA
jgi:hypothetical protein